MPRKAKKISESHSPQRHPIPDTDEGWNRLLNDKGKGRMTKIHIREAFGLLDKEIDAMKKEVIAIIHGTPGAASLLSRTRGTSKANKEQRDQADVKHLTHKLEEWLRNNHPQWFGEEAPQFPEAHKKEAVRAIVFWAKQKASEEFVKDDEEVNREYNKATPQPPSRSGRKLSLPLQHTSPKSPPAKKSPTKRGRSPSIDYEHPDLSHDDSDEGGVVGHDVEPGHRMRRDPIKSILYVNIRLLDSRTLETITRVPFQHFVPSATRADGVYDGGDVDLNALRSFIQENVPIAIASIWAKNKNAIRVHPDRHEVSRQSHLECKINEWLNGPRDETDFCVVLHLDEPTQEDDVYVAQQSSKPTRSEKATTSTLESARTSRHDLPRSPTKKLKFDTSVNATPARSRRHAALRSALKTKDIAADHPENEDMQDDSDESDDSNYAGDMSSVQSSDMELDLEPMDED